VERSVQYLLGNPRRFLLRFPQITLQLIHQCISEPYKTAAVISPGTAVPIEAQVPPDCCITTAILESCQHAIASHSRTQTATKQMYQCTCSMQLISLSLNALLQRRFIETLLFIFRKNCSRERNAAQLFYCVLVQRSEADMAMEI
jgi:hypothetical protein